MSAETTAGTDRLVAEADPWLRHRPKERRFWIGLACVAAFHVVAVFGVGQANPRIMGEKDGDKDAVTVDIISAADLARATAPPQQPPQPTPPQPVEPPSAQPEPQQAAPPEPAQPVEQPPEPKAEQPPPQPPQKKVADIPIDKEALDLLSLPDPAAPTPRPTPHQDHKPQPQKRNAPQARLTPPLLLPDPSSLPSGRGAAATRPPGITRTGENDDFGRGVIRALRQTMPSPNGLTGRVTIRLLLSENGNLVQVQLLNGGDPILNQSVVFASKQSSFPLPPKGSTIADRTFLVTYIYR